MTSQTFGHDAFSKYEWSHFAIRKSNNEYHHLVTLDEEDGCPALAAFGCVDMTGLLIKLQKLHQNSRLRLNCRLPSRHPSPFPNVVFNGNLLPHICPARHVFFPFHHRIFILHKGNRYSA